MGEVYRARDTSLRRDVALKILSPRFAGSQERLKRFRREAESLAALDHPNIVTVYSVGEEGGVHYISMELVDGRTLSRMIPKRGMPVDMLFDIAVPLIDAVAAAHARGVIHRDLKPSNVMVRRDGTVKVLDFGLAKHEPWAGTADSAASTSVLTEEHKILGTLAYMSPEQLQGAAIDARSDIFSFGVVLYQMATGRRPFEGASSADLISAIMREKPPKATELRDDLPPHLATILNRCLMKDPEERQQSAKDLREELDGLRQELWSGEAVSSAREVQQPRLRSRSTAWWLLPASVFVALVLGIWLASRVGGPPEGVSDRQLVAPIVTWPSTERDARISPIRSGSPSCPIGTVVHVCGSSAPRAGEKHDRYRPPAGR